MEQNEVLKLFEDTGALLNGHFQLRSGLHSPQFFNVLICSSIPEFLEDFARHWLKRCMLRLQI